MAYVLPDTIFSPEKEKTRRLMLEAGTIERFHNLGPDWFGDVRMGTVVVQLRRGSAPMASTFRSVLLAGDLRKQAITGKVPLSQIEARLGRDIPQDRCAASPTAEIEVFRSARDDTIMDRMIATSVTLSHVCDRGRGEEMSKAGLLWVCPACFAASVPANKRKADPKSPGGPKYNSKRCPECGLEMNETNVSVRHLVAARKDTGTATAPYMDGDDLTRRWQPVRAPKVLHVDLKGFPYKPERFYEEPKLLVRKTGVGLLATYDTSGVRFPQTVFFYRLKPEHAAAGYRHEFVLAALLSRTMSYFLFKRFAQIDPSRGHAHVTHERLKNLPIPTVDFTDAAQRRTHDEIVEHAESLLSGEAALGGPEDMAIDRLLWGLWSLDGEHGLHINLELAQVPAGQVMRDLFPDGLPKHVLTTANAETKELVATVVGT